MHILLYRILCAHTISCKVTYVKRMHQFNFYNRLIPQRNVHFLLYIYEKLSSQGINKQTEHNCAA